MVKRLGLILLTGALISGAYTFPDKARHIGNKAIYFVAQPAIQEVEKETPYTTQEKRSPPNQEDNYQYIFPGYDGKPPLYKDQPRNIQSRIRY